MISYSSIFRSISFSFFTLISIFLFPSESSAQTTIPPVCEEVEYYPFTKIAIPTLCDQYGDLEFDLTIGDANTTLSSQLSSTTITGNINIAGDFTIDNEFTFLDCVVKIEPGVTITIGRFNKLTLDNAKLFACEQLWDGIVPLFFSNLQTQNGTVIEDAVHAVHAQEKCFLSFEETTFNRNDIAGLQLEKSTRISGSPSVFQPAVGPVILKLSDTKFTCTAPVNGTSDKITSFGINSLVSFSSFPENFVEFNGIANGIQSDANITVSAKKFFFADIPGTAINMSEGHLILEDSEITNCRAGLRMSKIQRLRFVRNSIDYNELYPFNSTGDGINLSSTKIGGQINIALNHFSLTTPLGSSRLLSISGGFFGVNTNIDISFNDFFIDRSSTTGILLSGEFPVWTSTVLENNHIEMEGGVSVKGISCVNGNKHNLHLFSTGIRGIEKTIQASGGTAINLTGSILGSNNEVTGGSIRPPISSSPKTYFGRGIDVEQFANTLFCSNTISASTRGIFFRGANPGTQLIANNYQANGDDLTLQGGDALIGPQGVFMGDHNGNTWEDREVIFTTQGGNSIPGTLEASRHAFCDGCRPELSRIFVHTPQVTIYHPESIVTLSDWFIEDLLGTPLENCYPPFVLANNLDVMVATDSFEVLEPSPLRQDLMDRYLYYKLYDEPDYINAHPSFSSFIQQLEGSTIQQFYNLRDELRYAFSADSAILNQDSILREEKRDLLQLLYIADSVMITSTEPDTVQAAIEDKMELHEQLRMLDSVYYNEVVLAYENGQNHRLLTVRQLNDSISPPTFYGSLEQAVNQIYLNALIEQDGQYTAQQYQQLEQIALLDPDTAGIAVYQSRGLLPDCVLSSPPPVSSLQKSDQKHLSADQFMPAGFIYPNPARDRVTVTYRDEEVAEIRIMDLYGKIHAQFKVNPRQSLSIPLQLSSGIYFCTLSSKNGIISTQKLIIQ